MHELRINPDDPASIAHALNTEWLLTNGLGGYAMGTALGANARRYHGLLVAATKPPVGRIVALHSMIEQLEIDGQTIDLSSQQFLDGRGDLMLHPGGWRNLALGEFDATQARWTYRIGKLQFTRDVEVAQGENLVRVSYAVTGATSPATLRLRPIALLRDIHAMEHGEPHMNQHVSDDGRSVELRRGDAVLTLVCPNAVWRTHSQIWRGFSYTQDRARGLDWSENAVSPGFFEIAIRDGAAVELTAASDERHSQVTRKTTVSGFVAAQSPQSPGPDDPAALVLSNAASQFIVQRRGGGHGNEALTSIIAGYPWFSDWGRDTMIALPGLMLCTGQLDAARSTLLTFARHIKNGLIPNMFDESGAGHYNTVDAPLWFVHAVHELVARLSEPVPPPALPARGAGLPTSADLGELIAACRAMVHAYQYGADFNIHMDEDGLIIAGDESTQLTWMDAKRDGVVFTPRYGKAVEINALWHNALLCLMDMSDDEGERERLGALSRRAAASFREQFWWQERQCLHDCLMPISGGNGGVGYVPDGKLRPNQIFAASLPFSPLDDSQQRAVIEIVGERLLTPYGLRTLDRDDPAYCPRFEGDLFSRDRAYHQGTVWPWLIGAYCEALLRVERFSAQAKARVCETLGPLIQEMNASAHDGAMRCLGQIAEVYDGDPPHRPGGCTAQAWSVAEVLRAWMLAEARAVSIQE